MLDTYLQYKMIMEVVRPILVILGIVVIVYNLNNKERKRRREELNKELEAISFKSKNKGD